MLDLKKQLEAKIEQDKEFRIQFLDIIKDLEISKVFSLMNPNINGGYHYFFMTKNEELSKLRADVKYNYEEWEKAFLAGNFYKVKFRIWKTLSIIQALLVFVFICKLLLT